MSNIKAVIETTIANLNTLKRSATATGAPALHKEEQQIITALETDTIPELEKKLAQLNEKPESVTALDLGTIIIELGGLTAKAIIVGPFFHEELKEADEKIRNYARYPSNNEKEKRLITALKERILPAIAGQLSHYQQHGAPITRAILEDIIGQLNRAVPQRFYSQEKGFFGGENVFSALGDDVIALTEVLQKKLKAPDEVSLLQNQLKGLTEELKTKKTTLEKEEQAERDAEREANKQGPELKLLSQKMALVEHRQEELTHELKETKAENKQLKEENENLKKQIILFQKKSEPQMPVNLGTASPNTAAAAKSVLKAVYETPKTNGAQSASTTPHAANSLQFGQYAQFRKASQADAQTYLNNRDANPRPYILASVGRMTKGADAKFMALCTLLDEFNALKLNLNDASARETAEALYQIIDANLNPAKNLIRAPLADTLSHLRSEFSGACGKDARIARIFEKMSDFTTHFKDGESTAKPAQLAQYYEYLQFDGKYLPLAPQNAPAPAPVPQ